MTTVPRPFPAAMPHGEISEPLPGVFFVQGTMRFPGAIPMRFSRNMVIVRAGERLVLINTVRLDARGRGSEPAGQEAQIRRVSGDARR